MKGVQLAVIITAAMLLVVIVLIGSLLYHNSQTNNYQMPTTEPTSIPTTEPIIDALIADFKFTRYFPAEGLSWHCGFVIEVKNNGTASIEGLTLTFNSTSPYNITRTVGFYNTTEHLTIVPQKYVKMGQLCFLGPLEQAQTKVFYGFIMDNLRDDAKIHGYSCIATLKLGETILDEATIPT